MFIDTATIRVYAGKGGNGCSSFRREKFVPRGGPDGGDGGDGGNIIVVGDNNIHTLMDLRYRKTYKAQKGANGQGANKTGRSGGDCTIPLPVGTVIRSNGRLVGEILVPGEQFTVAKGGRGGKGNARFATSTHRAPVKCEPGGPGEEMVLDIELKVLADVGLVGFPNAGKSTLLAAVSAARPKIADYPFTTLEPNLGIVALGDYSSFVMADIPGLIEGAHAGKGLGDRFLRHIERTKILLFLIEIVSQDPKHEYEQLLRELELYNANLLKKPRIVALTKADLSPDTPLDASMWNSTVTVLPISSVAGINIETLKQLLASEIKKLRTQAGE